MTYTINKATIITPLIEEEVSRAAAAAYNDGGSLYDGIRITSKDSADISRAEDDAVAALLQATANISSLALSIITFTVPEMPAGLEANAQTEITRFIVLSSVAAWMGERYPSRQAEYSDRSNAALQNALTLLYTREKPSITR